MGKRIYWVLFGLIVLSGLVAMIYFGIQPRPVPKIKISQFENHTVLSNALLLRLREELRQNQLLFLGAEPERPEHLQIWKEFLRLNQEPGSRYDVVVIEQFFGVQDFPEATQMATKENFDVFLEGTQRAVAEGKRVVVIVPTVYASQAVYGNLVHNYKLRTKTHPMSLSITDFPRSREAEKEMLHPCIVEGVDTSGMGPFGCLVVQTARANYRKRFPPGQTIGLVQLVGLKDYLILYTQEK